VSLIWNAAATEWVAAFDGLGIHAAWIDAGGAQIGAAVTIDAATNSAIPSFAQGEARCGCSGRPTVAATSSS